MPSEADLSKKLIGLIKKRGGWARKAPGGIHGAGHADVYGVYRGRALIIETKLPGKEKTLTALQAATLESFGNAGAVARMITSVQQLERILNAIDRKSSGNRASTGKKKG